MGYATTNPYTNEVVQEFPYATDAEVDAALEAGHAAFQTWRTTSFEERSRLMSNAARLMRERRDEFARLNTLEMGKLYTEALGEADVVAGIFDHYARHAEELLKPVHLDLTDPQTGDAIVVFQPLGIVLAVEPWNVPLFQMARPLSAQLMAGNAMILKHASNVPQCAAAMERLIRDAGFPEGLFINLYATHAHIERILSDPRVAGVTLTGSEAAGARVAETAGKYVKKCVLELGGSDAMIVLDDADVDHAVWGAMMGRLLIGGQVCVGDKRLIIADPLYDEFVAKLTASVEALNPGDPMNPDTTFAPLSSQGAADAVKAQIAEAVAHGATAAEIGKPVPATGAFVQPTILTGLTPDNPVFYQEIFGPVLSLFRAADAEEAIAIANDSPYGLGGSIYSTNTRRAVKVAERMEAGAITINKPTIASPELPFGGIKLSGYGREFGDSGIKEFTNAKVINTASVGQLS
jgi:succinate-semialdehyde dehydrogenase/glutarate-semialdehyde dehydrogenase